MKIVKKIMLKGKERELEIEYSDKLVNVALNNNWNSLMFPSSNLVLLTATEKEIGLQFVLRVEGEVSITRFNEDSLTSLTGPEIYYDKEFKQAIKSNEVYDNPKKWNVLHNNWFNYDLFYKEKDNNLECGKWCHTGSEIFESECCTINELIDNVTKDFVSEFESFVDLV